MRKLILLAALFAGQLGAYVFNDSHVHLTNYVQEGTPINKFLEIMGDKVGRAALFGIPLQQQWSYRISGENAPKYYLDTDADLYYYSFTDAYIAMAYNSLSEEDKKRFDPMITGFNPTDMYAAEHVKRVLKTFPGVFSGIGEFTIHKEFVSSKVAGDNASLTDKALDTLFDFAAESGLLVLLHNDIRTPFSPDKEIPVYFKQTVDLFKRHPNTTIIWAHTGVGRVVQPLKGHLKAIEYILKDPKLSHVYFDLSWSEVAKYVVATPETQKVTADLINKYPDRFLFGTDEVAPKNQDDYLRVYYQYGPLWNLLSKEASQKVRFGNYERLYDDANEKVRTWEQKNLTPALAE